MIWYYELIKISTLPKKKLIKISKRGKPIFFEEKIIKYQLYPPFNMMVGERA